MASEEMKIEIGGENDVDLSTLSKVLANTTEALETIARASFDDNTSCRFVVKNIERGSFVVDIVQIATIGAQLLPQVSSAINTFKTILEIRNVLKGEKPKSISKDKNGLVTINGNAGQVTTNEFVFNVYSGNQAIEKNCAEAIEAVKKDGRRTAISYKFDDSSIEIERKDFVSMSKQIDTQTLTDNIKNVSTNRLKVKVFRPDFHGTFKWGIEMLGRAETAEITDEDFLKKVHNSEISFSCNTVIDADIETIYYSDALGTPLETPKPIYRIVKVYDIKNSTIEVGQLDF